ncbi:MAG: Na/Pi cotransporter family protein [Crocinitomicaceae bacterium]|nr:Na/Pi cotransporter family protein [Crocinitomicaceae bacterium]
MPNIDVWIFLAGLGVFLLGINQMEAGIKNLAGKSFKTFLKRYTKNVFSAILLGTLVTAVLQSSSVVSLMVMAFVGAGMMPLKNGIGVIFGANLGTTVTGWIVATVGFKFPIDAVALPILGIGGLLATLFANRVFFAELGRLLVGFGALFMGIEFMKEAVSVDTMDVSAIENLNFPPHLFFLVGTILTAIIQSSSATMAITLSALYAGLINLEIAGAIVIGGYLGTTVTVFLGALGGTVIRKRVALAHIGFNFLTSLLALIILIPLVRWIEGNLAFQDPLYQLVTFHSSFTLIGILVMLPFIGRYAQWVEGRMPIKEHNLSPKLAQVPPEVFEGALEAMRAETDDLWERIKSFRFNVFNAAKARSIFDTKDDGIMQQYKAIQTKEGELISYYLKVQNESLNPGESSQLDTIVHAVKRLSLATKNIQSVMHTIERMKEDEGELMATLRADIQAQFKAFYHELKLHFDQEDTSELQQIIYDAYRNNVNLIYSMVQKGVLSKTDLTSFLHMNSQIKQFKENLVAASQSIGAISKWNQ